MTGPEEREPQEARISPEKLIFIVFSFGLIINGIAYFFIRYFTQPR